MLADDDRARIIRSNVDKIPLQVATLHACLHPDEAVRPTCREPWYGQGIVATWSEADFWLAMDVGTVQIPWLSAVRTWVPGTTNEEEIKRTIQAYSHGKVEAPHP